MIKKFILPANSKELITFKDGEPLFTKGDDKVFIFYDDNRKVECTFAIKKDDIPKFTEKLEKYYCDKAYNCVKNYVRNTRV